MLNLLKSMPARDLVAIEGPTFAAALVIAELAFKFHSFTLECLAFLATWTVLSAVVRHLIPRRGVAAGSTTT